VEPLPPGINTERWESDIFVSPTEDYLIFARTDDPDGLGGDDLFVSVRNGDVWSEPRALESPVNSSAYDYGAFVSADGAHLYFTSHRGGIARIYRVETGGIGLPLS
jgi:Tol biopolymer transport system component